ncbi:MAG TPA: GTPase HflX [Geminicoccaceae bacterium]|nr:GTPase HflX [Geminicoccaceae bacterium]
MTEASDGEIRAAGRALVLHPYEPHARSRTAQPDHRDPEHRLEEAARLAEALGLEVAGAELVPLRRAVPATLLGAGKVDELKARLEQDPVELVVIDGVVSPVQQRNLERRWQAKVIDRTGLILEIFGERAKTREGVLQVELAALTYQRSRLVRSWTHLERQRGGFGFLGGPGESQLELDRRRIGERIASIKKELEEVRRTRQLHRDARARVPYPLLALVGYTNAGKSTLFNRLTGATVGARDQLFATLDPTMRVLVLPSGLKAIVSDTVGFITDLPTMLVAAFRATLEEVLTADVILHVRDIAHADSAAQRADVHQVLEELGIPPEERERRVVEVWNKADLLGEEQGAALAAEAARQPGAAMVSARTGAGLQDLLALIDSRFAGRREVVELEVPHADGALLAWLHERGEVLERSEDAAATRVRVALDPKARAQLADRLAKA